MTKNVDLLILQLLELYCSTPEVHQTSSKPGINILYLLTGPIQRVEAGTCSRSSADAHIVEHASCWMPPKCKNSTHFPYTPNNPNRLRHAGSQDIQIHVTTYAERLTKISLVVAEIFGQISRLLPSCPKKCSCYPRNLWGRGLLDRISPKLYTM